MRPVHALSLRHLALFVSRYEDCIEFYTKLLGMKIEWQPDVNNTYLTSGIDNLALHRVNATFQPSQHQRLDHIGFVVETAEAVDSWYVFLRNHNVPLKTQPRQHRDGARSFYCYDPDGNTLQIIYHPPIAKIK